MITIRRRKGRRSGGGMSASVRYVFLSVCLPILGACLLFVFGMGGLTGVMLGDRARGTMAGTTTRTATILSRPNQKG